MSSFYRSYELAGGLYPAGWARFSDDEVRTVGPMYGDVKVTLKSGEVIIVRPQYKDQLERLVR